MLSMLWNLIFFCLALGILVTVHEAGHFFAARLCGVKVLRFSIGFGSVLFKRTGRDGCEYALSLIPLGGYVKMLGENEKGGEESEKEPAAADDREHSFKEKSAGKRAFIIFAGPLCNILLAVFLLTGLNMSGVIEVSPVVADVAPSSPADRAGFKEKDLITSVDGAQVTSWNAVVLDLVGSAGNEKPVELNVVRDLGRGEQAELELSMKDFNLASKEDPLALIGIKRYYGEVSRAVASVMPDSPASRAGIQPGDIVESVNGVKTPSWYRMQYEIENSESPLLSLIISRNEKLYSVELAAEVKYDKNAGKDRRIIGIGTTVTPDRSIAKEVNYSFVQALEKSLSDTWSLSKLVTLAVYKMVSGAISPESISGPIAIAKGAGDSASSGIAYFIGFLAAISVNLGILNLVPIPILDGGQLLFIASEAVTGRTPGAKTQAMLTSIGFSLLLLLMALAVFNDLRGL